MRIIDADKFLAYLISSKHIDGLTCGEVKEAIEMCKVDVLDEIRAEINKLTVYYTTKDKGTNLISQRAVNRVFDKYKAESEGKE